MYPYVCTNVCMFAHMYEVCIYANVQYMCIYVWHVCHVHMLCIMNVFLCVRVCTFAQNEQYPCTYVSESVYVIMYVYMCLCTVCLCVCIYTSTYLCMYLCMYGCSM
jgi:hypothetical protein